MTEQAIQDTYNPKAAICYGCGVNNPHGHHIKTYWDGQLGHSTFIPKPEHTAFPGVVYGGLLASLIDCHSIGTAIAAMYDAEGRIAGSDPEITCVTGNLNINYLKPTPMGVQLTMQARIQELTPKKAIVHTELFANGELCVTGDVVAVRVRSRLGMDEK